MPTVLHRLHKWAEATPDVAAQRFKQDGEWKTITAREYRDRVYYLALFLEARGIDANQAGAILSYNCPEWVQIHLATLLLGAKSAGLYPNSTTKDVHYILEHTEATVLSIQNRTYFEKIQGEDKKGQLPNRLKLLLVFDGDTSISPKAIAFSDALAEGRKITQSGKAKRIDEYLAKIDPKVGAYMIYTSGTTGNPKGALISHDNLAYTSDKAIETWKLPMANGDLFSFLPLCHVAETIQNIGVGISQRYTVSFCTKFDNVSTELVEVQPSMLLCVPRLWEKMMEGVMAKVKSAPALRKNLAHWALSVGQRVAKARYAGQAISPVDRIQHALAEKLVLGKVRQALGLKNAKLLASGAAALPAHVVRWFDSLGLEIMNTMGQTESTALICMAVPGRDCSGTIGRPIPGFDFKLADDGEILTRGRHVFVGYFKDPVGTAEVLGGGWLHTGDLGELNPDGLVLMRGRKKEVMKTSGGKMIAPLPIEEKLKTVDIISQVCMVGDGRKYLSALVTLSESKLKEIQELNGVATQGKVVVEPGTVQRIQEEIEQINKTLAGYEQIKKFSVLSREFSIADGEMTPTLKMKRNVIEKNFSDVIDRMYE